MCSDIRMFKAWSDGSWHFGDAGSLFAVRCIARTDREQDCL